MENGHEMSMTNDRSHSFIGVLQLLAGYDEEHYSHILEKLI